MKPKTEEESLLTSPLQGEGASDDDHLRIERELKGPPIEIAEQFEGITFRSHKKKDKTDDKVTLGGSSSDFSRQYAHAYASRLFATRLVLEKKVKEEWQSGKHPIALKKIADLCENTARDPGRRGSPSSKKRGRDDDTADHEQHITMQEGVTVAIIGTLFKIQPEKPSILQELVDENPLLPSEPRTNYTSPKDTLLMEDETTRVHLVPSEGCGMSIDSVVNGIVCAVKGKPTISGKFDVEDVIWATPSPSEWPEMRENDVEMIFVSGLLAGSSRGNMAKLDLLFDYLQGLGGGPAEHSSSVKSKTRVFFVGDLFGHAKSDVPKYGGFTSDTKKAAEDRVSRTEVAKKLDKLLDELSQTMEVYLIPGELDPAEPMFPQAPIHHCILPLSSRRSTFHSMSNPTRLSIPLKVKGGNLLDVVLCGGQNVSDALKNTNIKNPVEMGHSLLKWGHLCPTTPDTLPLHPGIKDDPFILGKKLPNILVLGGQGSRFLTREWNGTRIVTIPSFASTGIAVVLDKTLNFVPLNIKI